MVIGSDMSHDLWGPWREEIAADHEEERYYLNTDTGEKRALVDAKTKQKITPTDSKTQLKMGAQPSPAPLARVPPL